MPTIARIGPYRCFFFSNEGTEPPHVHVQRERRLAKFWLVPVELAGATGFGPPELRRIERMVRDNQQDFLERWNRFFER
jgi:hypothetical protein